jgi:hypothetical protein
LQVLEGATVYIHSRLDAQADLASVVVDVIALRSVVYGALVSPALMVTWALLLRVTTRSWSRAVLMCTVKVG